MCGRVCPSVCAALANQLWDTARGLGLCFDARAYKIGLHLLLKYPLGVELSSKNLVEHYQLAPLKFLGGSCGALETTHSFPRREFPRHHPDHIRFLWCVRDDSH
ncbi:hypothetical protein TcWFU_003703 [Taenia crassiceps]|uniref:Uncharacterized protein n=1 Tax=Taenia crassiceps TaxID=6207 RepID=A0ABR4QKQ4_9CEST